MFWEHSPYWTNIASHWLIAQLSCGEEEIKIKMDDGVAISSLASEGICLFVGDAALSRGPRMK